MGYEVRAVKPVTLNKVYLHYTRWSLGLTQERNRLVRMYVTGLQKVFLSMKFRRNRLLWTSSLRQVRGDVALGPGRGMEREREREREGKREKERERERGRERWGIEREEEKRGIERERG